MKLVCAIFTLDQIAFSYLFQASKRAKQIMLTILKCLEPPIVVEQFWIVLNKQNDIFEFRIISHPLLSQPLNGISSPKNNPYPGILANLKRPLDLFVLSFCLDGKGHVDMATTLDFLKILQVINQFKENRNIVNITLVKTWFEFLWTTN